MNTGKVWSCWAEDCRGERSRSRLHLQQIEPFRAFCSFLPASLHGVKRSGPNCSCSRPLLWVQQAQLNPCSHSQKTRPQVSAQRLISASKEASL